MIGDKGKVYLPKWRKKPMHLCLALERRGFICNRPKGHGGRHAAVGIDRHVCAVWR